MPGRVFAIVGPSGAGKDTLIAAARQARPDLHIVRRVITRPEEPGGEPYEGVTPEEFARRKADGRFVLDWQAHGLHYGIPDTVETAMADGAMQALAEGDAARHDALVAGATASLRHCEVIALAQFSLARARQAAEAASGRPVLTTPDAAVAELRRRLGAA